MKKYPLLYEELAELVVQYASTKNPVIVDVGVGPGLLCQAIYKKIPKATIIGIDPNKKMLELAQENVKLDSFKVLQGFSENIVLKDNSVDIVVSRFSLSYWSNPLKSFTEISRILKPQGCVIIEAINKDFSLLKLFFIKIHMLLKKAGADVTKYHSDVYKQAYTIGEVEEFFLQSGFEIIKRQGTKKEWKFILVGKKP